MATFISAIRNHRITWTSAVSFAQIPLKKSWVWRGFGWITVPKSMMFLFLLAAYSERGGVMRAAFPEVC